MRAGDAYITVCVMRVNARESLLKRLMVVPGLKGENEGRSFERVDDDLDREAGHLNGWMMIWTGRQCIRQWAGYEG